MQEQKLKDYLSSKSKEDLENIIINHYKFLVNELEKTEKEYRGFVENNMDILVKSTKKEYDFIFLQMKWYENYIEEKIEKLNEIIPRLWFTKLLDILKEEF
jgi:hypothetical protein